MKSRFGTGAARKRARRSTILSELAGAGAGSILATPGLGRARADSTIPVPDDPSITFDDGASARFRLWGATFQESPQGPLPPAACKETNEFRINLVNQDRAVFLIWAGHSRQPQIRARAAALLLRTRLSSSRSLEAASSPGERFAGRGSAVRPASPPGSMSARACSDFLPNKLVSPVAPPKARDDG